MNAVNLIPLERRRGEAPTLPGVPFLGLVLALVVALGGTAAYVDARDHVSTRQSELTHLQSATAAWSSAAARYAPAVAEVKQHAKRYVQLGELFGERADWSLLLGQLAGVMPAHAQLSSLTASDSASATATTGVTGSGITLTGCAISQPVVADTMVALRRLTGVSSVSLSSSSSGGSGGSSGSASAGTCPLAVQFSLALQFAPSVGSLEQLQKELSGSSSSTSTASQSSAGSNSTGDAS